MPTYNQWAQGFNLAVRYPEASSPGNDADGDGVTNTREMEADTDPTDAKSALRMEDRPRPSDLSVSDQAPPNPDQHALYFQSVPGKIYELQTSPDLRPPWNAVATFIATSGQKRVLVSEPAGNGYYRMRLRP